MKDELKKIEAEHAEEIAKAKENIQAEQRKKGGLIEKKKEELERELIENNKLKEQLKECKDKVTVLKGELNIATEKEKSLERKSKHCSTTLNNVFK